jgi:hypothetical protein
MIFDKKTFDKLFKGFYIIDAAIRNPNRQCYVLRHKKKSVVRFLFTYNDKEKIEDRYCFKQLPDFSYTTVAYNSHPVAHYIGIELGCRVYRYDADNSVQEDDHPYKIDGSDLVGVVNKVVRIGQTIYSAGFPQRLYKRTENNQWQSLTHDLPVPSDLNSDEALGFKYFWNDADGFSETNIYTVGGDNEVFHFDGTQWQQIHFPFEDYKLSTVCCAGDGNVYVSGMGQSLYRWDKQTWTKLKSGASFGWFTDIKWFKGKLYCSDESFLRVLENDELITVKELYPKGAIDISPDGNYMLVAGRETAHLYDGEKWETVIDSLSV